jgi:PhnB protein
MKRAHPHLNFAGNTEEAFTFYRSVFAGEFTTLLRFRDFGPAEGAPATDLDKIAHISLPIGQGCILMGTDALESHGRTLLVGNNVSFSLESESADEAERLFGALADGGSVTTPLMQTEWAERYGMCADRFGIQWMVNFTGQVQFGG